MVATNKRASKKAAAKKKPDSKKPAASGRTRLPRSERAKLKALLTRFEERLQTENDSKISVSDYIRLLQMKREMDQKKPRDVEVKWVDTLGEEENASEK